TEQFIWSPHCDQFILEEQHAASGQEGVHKSIILGEEWLQYYSEFLSPSKSLDPQSTLSSLSLDFFFILNIPIVNSIKATTKTMAILPRTIISPL
ncbi:6010_t:CDS:2, partial [Entrophospora sp. SA101]